MDKKIIIILIAVALVIAAGTYLFKGRAVLYQKNQEKMAIVTSFYPLYFLAEQIGGEKVFVENITPAGAEPHEYELTAQDVIKIQKSRVLIINGAGLESWQENIQKIIDHDRTAIVVAGEKYGNRETADPHVWLSPLLAKGMADAILAALIKTDPANERYYTENVDKLKEKLDNLDRKYRQGLLECKTRDMVTSHAAFSYLANEYGLRQIPIAGLSPDQEPSAKSLAGIIEFIKQKGITHIFFEPLASQELANTIASETGAKTLTLNPLEGLSYQEIYKGENYITVMERNFDNLKTALQCTQ